MLIGCSCGAAPLGAYVEGGASVVCRALLCQSTRRTSGSSNAAPDDFLSEREFDGGRRPCWPVTSDPTGLHRVLDDRLVLPQAAQRLDTRSELWPDEVRIRVEKLNLDAASFRQLERKHDGDGDAGPRPRCSRSSPPAARCRTPRPGPAGCWSAPSRRWGSCPRSGLAVGDRVATLVSLTLTPLVIEDGLGRLGRPRRAGALRRLRRPLRPLDRGRDPGRPAGRPGAVGDGRLRRPGPDRARRGRVRRLRPSPSSAAPASPAR